MSRKKTRTFVLALIATVGALCVAAGTASALPCDPTRQECGGGETGPVTQFADRTLTVTNGGGTVTGQGINCGSDCTDNDQVSRTCDGLCDFWPGASSWSLSASYPVGGYTADWSDWTGCANGPTCDVSLGDSETGDAAGTVAVTWRDIAAPSATFAPAAKVGASTSALTASGSDNSGAIHHFTWTVDNVQQAATGSSLPIGAIAAGSHVFKVQAFDAAGNGSAVITRTVAIDRSAGVTVGTLPAITNAATVPLSFTTDADVTSRSCTLNNAGATSCTSPWSGITAATPDGTYAYRVTVTDDVGNSKTSAPVTTVLDRTVPSLAFTDGPTEGQQVVTRSVSVTFSQTEAHPGTVTCKLDGNPVACTPGTAVALPNLADGQHTFSVRAVDGATNEKTITRTFGVQGPTDGGNTDTGGDTGSTGGTTNTGGTTTTSTGGGTPDTGGGGGQPTTTAAPEAFDPRITSVFAWRASRTWFSVLRVRQLPANAKIVLTCKGKGCPVKSKKLTAKGGPVNVLKALGKKLRLRTGAVLELRITSASGAVKRARWQVRAGKRPKLVFSCAAPGAKLGVCK